MANPSVWVQLLSIVGAVVTGVGFAVATVLIAKCLWRLAERADREEE